MGAGHDHGRAAWGSGHPGPIARARAWFESLLGLGTVESMRGIGELPLRLRRDELAPRYLAAEADEDHRRAGATAVAAMEAAIGREEWWIADAWAHRALWHFERGDLALQATRQARRIGDLRWAAGDPASARRYYAEAIDEARDIGAEHEQGLAALGLGRALLDLGSVTEARRLAGAAVILLERASAPTGEIDAARALLGTEVSVSGPSEGNG
jgi:tetratricopeptide (TPR) repeat protein